MVLYDKYNPVSSNSFGVSKTDERSYYVYNMFHLVETVVNLGKRKYMFFGEIKMWLNGNYSLTWTLIWANFEFELTEFELTKLCCRQFLDTKYCHLKYFSFSISVADLCHKYASALVSNGKVIDCIKINFQFCTCQMLTLFLLLYYHTKFSCLLSFHLYNISNSIRLKYAFWVFTFFTWKLWAARHLFISKFKVF